MIYWSKYPLARVCFPFVGGILAGLLCNWYVSIYLLVGFWMTTFLLHWIGAGRFGRREQLFSLVLLADMFCIGNVITFYRVDEHFSDDYIHHLREASFFIVHVTEPPIPRPNSLMVYA